MVVAIPISVASYDIHSNIMSEDGGSEYESDETERDPSSAMRWLRLNDFSQSTEGGCQRIIVSHVSVSRTSQTTSMVQAGESIPQDSLTLSTVVT